MKQFLITKRFTGGLLKGLTLSEITSAEFAVGQRVAKPCGGSPYEVTTIEPLTLSRR